MSETAATNPELHAEYVALLLSNAERGYLHPEDVAATREHLSQIPAEVSLPLVWGAAPEVTTGAVSPQQIRFAFGSHSVELRIPIEGHKEPLRIGPNIRIPGLVVIPV